MARNYDYNGDPCGEFGTALREVNKLQDEIARLRLTDEERGAIERLCEAVTEYSDIDRKENGCHADDDMAAVAVARGLMKRMV
jgi:hypothetical protein